jgi:hypothetical protein
MSCNDPICLLIIDDHPGVRERAAMGGAWPQQ